MKIAQWSLSAIFLFCSFDGLLAQINSHALQITPQFPRQGEKVRFTYYPSTTPLKGSKKIESLVYAFNNTDATTSFSLHEIRLRRNKDNSYSGSLVLDSNSTGIAFVFSDSIQKDNNKNNGYVMPVYDNNRQPVHGAIYALGKSYTGGSWKDFLDIDPQYEKALAYMQTEWELSPGLHSVMRGYYFYLLMKVKNKDAEIPIKNELQKMEDSSVLNEDDYSFMERSYRRINDTTNENRLFSIEKAKFPEGDWMRTAKIDEINKEKDTLKQLAMMDDFLKSNLPKTESEKSQYRFLETRAAISAAAMNKFDVFDGYLKDVSADQKADVYNDVAWSMALNNNNLSLAKRLSLEATKQAKAEWINPPEENKPAYLTNKEWRERLKTTFANLGDTYAFVLYRLKDYKEGLNFDKLIAVSLQKMRNPDLNYTYAMLLEKMASSAEVKKQIEKMVRIGTANTKTKEILKTAYAVTYKSDKGFDDYLTKLENSNKDKAKAALVKQMVNEKAPLFELTNLEGKAISLEAMKGKVVITDFWATWCGPCKASCPAMEKIVEKYKGNPDVIFVFIDTWENDSDRIKKVKAFISEHNYSFNVLFDAHKPGSFIDQDFTAVDDYKVNGIPAKFVIDKNGNIRFRSDGFSGNDQALMDEMDVMIGLVTKEK